MTDRRPAIGRRRFLARAGGLSLASLAWACGRGASDDGNRLVVENWAEYIDPTRDGDPGTVDRFRAATGIDLEYRETINDNQEYFARLQPRLGTGRIVDADVIVPTYWIAERLIRLGWLDPLPLDRMRNLANLEDSLRDPPWDPAGRYTLPWATTLTGIGYNRDVTGRDLERVADLLDPRFKGKVAMLSEMRDTIGLLLLGLGIDASTVSSFEEASPAFELLERAKRSGQIRAFTGGDYTDDLSTGNFAACLAWASDILLLARDNPSVRFVIPEEGGMRAVDTMVMPRGARHREAAARWMDFHYDPVQAARITAHIPSVSPVKGVQQELARIAPELAANPLVFPDASMRARLRVFASLPEDVELQFDAAFSRIIGA